MENQQQQQQQQHSWPWGDAKPSSLRFSVSQPKCPNLDCRYCLANRRVLSEHLDTTGSLSSRTSRVSFCLPSASTERFSRHEHGGRHQVKGQQVEKTRRHWSKGPSRSGRDKSAVAQRSSERAPSRPAQSDWRKVPGQQQSVRGKSSQLLTSAQTGPTDTMFLLDGEEYLVRSPMGVRMNRAALLRQGKNHATLNGWGKDKSGLAFRRSSAT